MENYEDDKTGQNLPDHSSKPKVEIHTDGSMVNYTLPGLHYRYAELIRKRGFSNGLLRIPQEVFEHYITAYEENKRLGIVISKMEQDRLLKEEKIHKTESERDQLLAAIVRKKQEDNRQKENKTKFSDLAQKSEVQLELIKEQFEKNYPAYGWIGTILFLIAGLAFIFTDISIIKSIAFLGFDLKNDEALIFAIGFASLVVILKPLVDRVFEKPYQNNKKLAMHGLLIFIGLSTILALGFMGAFRNQAFVASVKKDNIESELERLNAEVDSRLRSSSDPEILKLEENLESITAGASGDLVQWIFILSSILFAVAGAICFSIGVPSLRIHTNRLSGKVMLYFQRIYFLRKLKNADKHWRLAENQWKIAEQRLALLPNLTILEAELKRIINEIQVARAAQHQVHTEAVIAIYRDNYQRGERYIPSEEELAQFEMLLSEQSGIKQRNFQLNRQFSGSNLFNSQYLHEYIRQKIHKDNKQKFIPNGQIHHPDGIK